MLIEHLIEHITTATRREAGHTLDGRQPLRAKRRVLIWVRMGNLESPINLKILVANILSKQSSQIRCVDEMLLNTVQLEQ